jgi:hypothetical protein
VRDGRSVTVIVKPVIVTAPTAGPASVITAPARPPLIVVVDAPAPWSVTVSLATTSK